MFTKHIVMADDECSRAATRLARHQRGLLRLGDAPNSGTAFAKGLADGRPARVRIEIAFGSKLGMDATKKLTSGCIELQTSRTAANRDG